MVSNSWCVECSYDVKLEVGLVGLSQKHVLLEIERYRRLLSGEVVLKNYYI
jgi:hypothetical protein